MFTPELLWPVGALVLLVALIYGMIQYKTRNRANDPVTEDATKALFDDPAHYTEDTRKAFEKDIRPS